MPRAVLTALLTLTLFAPACAHYPINPPLDRWDPSKPGYRMANLPATEANTDSVLVCLAFSGGGTRSAAMAYGVLRKLANTPIAGGTKTLLDEVDVISSSSGGSFAAAYYGLFGRERFFREFEEKVLWRDVGLETFMRVIYCPYNLVRVCSPWFNRSDLAAELYTNTIFGDLTYTHLQRRGRPFVVLNASELATGRRFEFTQDRFDELEAGLGLVPVSRAVAASSAFPLLLTPVAIYDYSRPDGVRWVHLVDGGIVDNMALGHLIESYRRGAIRELIAAGKVEHLVFIVVNARNRIPEAMVESSEAPGAVSVVTLGLGAAIDKQGTDAIEILSEMCRSSGGDDGAAGAAAPAIHLIEVDLEDIRGLERREQLLAVPTTFGLEPEVIQELISASYWLLDGSEALARLVEALR